MPKLLGVDAGDVNQSLQGFGYTSISIDKLGATEYTIVSVVVDKTTSVIPFKDQLEDMLQVSLESCKSSPRALNLLARSTAFSTNWNSSNIEELHGFTLLNSLDTTQFRGTINPSGSTPLYDATLEAIDTTHDYAKKLYDNEYLCNAVIFIITDGDDNASRHTSPADIKEAVQEIKKEECLESINTILIGINDTDPHFKQRLEEFRKEAEIDQYVSVGEVTKGKLAKLAQFVSQSISSTSQALGTGQASQPISNFTF